MEYDDNENDRVQIKDNEDLEGSLTYLINKKLDCLKLNCDICEDSKKNNKRN